MNNDFRFRQNVAVVVGIAVLALCRSSQAQTPSSRPEIRIEKVDLSNIGPESVEASVRLSVLARSTATLRKVLFEEVTVNGMRIRVPPLQGPIRLQNGRLVEGLPDVSAILTYQELESLEPLRRALRDGHAEVHAVLSAQVELTLFQKLVLLAGGAWVRMTVDQQAPVELPGGGITRFAALATLTAAEPIWAASQSAHEFLKSRTALAEQVRTSIPGHLIVFETQYELRSRKGEVARMRASSCGFLVGNGRVVAPAEAAEPWLFDDSIAEALERRDVSVDERNTEVLATVVEGNDADTARTFSLQHHEIRILKKLSASETAISSESKRSYHIMFRNRVNNAVLFEIPALGDSGSGLAFSRQAPGSGWQQAAVVRIDREHGNKPVLWLTEARWEDGRYQIRDIVDGTAFGSPLWIEDGVAGLLQDESSAADMNSLSGKLR